MLNDIIYYNQNLDANLKALIILTQTWAIMIFIEIYQPNLTYL